MKHLYKPKTFYIGLVGSGKTTLYRKLNEEQTFSAVELELPQSCIDDETIKQQLFNIYYNNKNIDCIISHPYYLPKNFYKLISPEDKIEYLEVPIKVRMNRVSKRAKKNKSNCIIFPKEFFIREEKYFEKFKIK